MSSFTYEKFVKIEEEIVTVDLFNIFFKKQGDQAITRNVFIKVIYLTTYITVKTISCEIKLDTFHFEKT